MNRNHALHLHIYIKSPPKPFKLALAKSAAYVLGTDFISCTYELHALIKINYNSSSCLYNDKFVLFASPIICFHFHFHFGTRLRVIIYS